VTDVDARGIQSAADSSRRAALSLANPELGAEQLAISDYARVLRRRSRRILLIGLVGGIAGYLFSFLIPAAYRADVMMVPMGSQDRFGALGALGIDLQSLGIGADGAGITPAMYPDIAESRSVLSGVLTDVYLVPAGGSQIAYIDWLKPDGEGTVRYERAIAILREAISTSVDRRTGILTLSVRDRNPGIASQVANSLSESLQHVVLTVLATQAGQQRRFIESRLPEIRRDLSVAEGSLQAFREKNLRIGNSPRLALEEARLNRAVREQEEIYLTVSRQYELAKIQENRDVPVLATLDRAVPPIKRFWPRRSLFALLGLMLGAGTIVFWSVYREPPGTRA
jgi:uncharacterized protein involved in exopolysaccharide biosynthesis